MYSLASVVNPVARSAQILSINGCICARPLSNFLSQSNFLSVSLNDVTTQASFRPSSCNIQTAAFSTDTDSASRLLHVDVYTSVITNSGVRKFHHWANSDGGFMKLYQVNYEQVRYGASSFFTKHNAEQLWKSVASVSSAGRRRGRGKQKDRKIIRDLNKGQVIGIGKDNIRWPGLSAPIIRGREIVQRHQLPPDEKYEENLIKMRDTVFKGKKFKVAALDRGYSGGVSKGRRIGPPDPIAGETFENFDTIILEQKAFVQQTSHSGRARTIFVICGTGNGKGLFGYSMAKTPEGRTAQRKAKNRAAQRLMYIPTYDNRTVFHNFHSRYHNTKIYAWPKGPGYGLVCHRIIKSMCQLIGIKDLYVKVEGSMNPFSIIRAFLIGLLRQKTYEELAEETGYHIVELNQQYDNFPHLIASPSCPILASDEVPDFRLYCMDDKMFSRPKPRPNPLLKFPGYEHILREKENTRHLYDTQVALMAEHGELRSFLTEKYPECKPPLPPWTRSVKAAKKKKQVEEGE